MLMTIIVLVQTSPIVEVTFAGDGLRQALRGNSSSFYYVEHIIWQYQSVDDYLMRIVSYSDHAQLDHFSES